MLFEDKIPAPKGAGITQAGVQLLSKIAPAIFENFELFA